MKTYKFIKFKKLDEFALRDLRDNTVSFGLYKVFDGQKELAGAVNSCYLNKKYNDNSMTDENVVKILTQHIDSNFLQFSMTGLTKDFVLNKVAPQMYKDYSKNRGFLLYYEFKTEEEIKAYFRKYYPLLRDVEYGKGKLDLTGFYDCFLQCAKKDGFDYKAFNNILHETRHSDDLLRFLVRKTDYPKSYEDEVRIVIRKDESIIIEDSHAVLPFAKPTTVCIPINLNQKDRYEIIKICNAKEIDFKFIDFPTIDMN